MGYLTLAPLQVFVIEYSKRLALKRRTCKNEGEISRHMLCFWSSIFPARCQENVIMSELPINTKGDLSLFLYTLRWQRSVTEHSASIKRPSLSRSNCYGRKASN